MICVLAVSNVPLNVLQAVVVNVKPDGLALDPGPVEDNASTSEKVSFFRYYFGIFWLFKFFGSDGFGDHEIICNFIFFFYDLALF